MDSNLFMFTINSINALSSKTHVFFTLDIFKLLIDSLKAWTSKQT